MVRSPLRIMLRLIVSVIVEPAVFAVVLILPPRVIPAPERVKALVLPVDPSLVKSIPPIVESAARLLTAPFRVLPTNVMALVKVGRISLSQLAAVFQLLSPGPLLPPSQIWPADAEETASSELPTRAMKERSVNGGFMGIADSR